jgi:asparagine synthase (glutamine-hydrolysing)
MCGICGQYNFMTESPIDSAAIKKMAAAIAHRGPDDEGQYTAESIVLGFRRLSIIDLEGGHQPMSDADGAVWVVFNGEIYNFPDLKAELQGYGHLFRTNSDTEVIIHGYKQWGNDVLSHLNGMFGLAIWDEKRRQLMLARDRMGIKLLYYKISAGQLKFGSEIRALLATEKSTPEIDPVSLSLFLRYRYTPSPLTMFHDIRKLSPGTRLIVKDGVARIERWWNFEPVPLNPPPSVDEAEEELLELYKRAVKRQVISDVPLGLLLSGGVDSGMLLALMNQTGKFWKSYTVGFGSSFRGDELYAAAETAKTLQSSNVSIELNREVFNASLSHVISCLEEPVATASIVPMYHLCKRAREDVKVVLMGQGPDELFGGYKRHLGVRYSQHWRSLPEWVRTPISKALAALPRNETIKRGLSSLQIADRTRMYQHVFSLLPGGLIDNLFREGALPDSAGDKILDCWGDFLPLMKNTDELGGLQFLEIRSSLPDELLMYGDKLSMAHGLEVRVPYLDHEVVEYVERLPAEYKVRWGSGKWLHRRVCRNFLPKEIIRRRKGNFAASVVDDWFRESYDEKMEDRLLNTESRIYGYLRPQAIQQLVKDHRAGWRDHHKILFSLIVLEEWLRAISGQVTLFPDKLLRSSTYENRGRITESAGIQA